MQPTHAIYFKDNWDGEGDKYWLLAAFVDDAFYTEAGAPVIKHEGDEVLKAVALDDTDAMAAIEAAKVEMTSNHQAILRELWDMQLNAQQGYDRGMDTLERGIYNQGIRDSLNALAGKLKVKV